jgi:hypothetical protein
MLPGYNEWGFGYQCQGQDNKQEKRKENKKTLKCKCGHPNWAHLGFDCNGKCDAWIDGLECQCQKFVRER